MNCRIGDIAIIISAAMPENLGLLVEVIDVWPEDTHYWHVKSLCGPRDRLDGVRSAEGMAPDRCLRPIRGGVPPVGVEASEALVMEA